MAERLRIVQVFSPSKRARESPVESSLRKKQPSPEKNLPLFTSAILSTRESPTLTEQREIAREFEIELGESTELKTVLENTKHILLDKPLVIDGRPSLSYNRDELLSLFPETCAFFVGAFLTIRVRVLPPKPWPFTVGGLPLHITTHPDELPFLPGHCGRGPRLTSFDLKEESFSRQILHQACLSVQGLGIPVKSIFWMGGIWQIIITEDFPAEKLPTFIYSRGAFYDVITENDDLTGQLALHSKVPRGIEYDDSLYVTTADALLRPGIMLSSTILPDGTFKSTTSGVLVLDSKGECFITVASHGFNSDGKVFHPNPITGVLIGEIVKCISGCDVSFVRLCKGLQYTNKVFGTLNSPDGIQISRISEPNFYDIVYMNDPYSGQCEGQVLGVGETVEGDGCLYIGHHWVYFENGMDPCDESSGSPIWDNADSLVGFFRYVKREQTRVYCLVVDSYILAENGYEISSVEYTF